jgi:hypothetical protein
MSLHVYRRLGDKDCKRILMGGSISCSTESTLTKFLFVLLNTRSTNRNTIHVERPIDSYAAGPVQFRTPDIITSNNITMPAIRFDMTLLDDQYGGKLYTDINELFDDRLQVYGGLAGGGDILNSQVSTHTFPID